MKYEKQLEIDFVRENKALFEHGESEFQYITDKKINVDSYVALFLDVFHDNGFDFDFRSERRVWVLVPKETADEIDYIKITFDGYITAEKKGEIPIIDSSSSGYDDIELPRIFFIGQRKDCWHNIEQVVALTEVSITDIMKSHQGKLMKAPQGDFMSDEDLDKLLNQIQRYNP